MELTEESKNVVDKEYEIKLRQKIGCYRCDILNASCHRTCKLYITDVLPYLRKINENIVDKERDIIDAIADRLHQTYQIRNNAILYMAIAIYLRRRNELTLDENDD